MRVQSLVAALAIVAGCTPIRSFVYGPTPATAPPDAPGRINGHVAVTYQVPADDPRGEVQLAVARVATVNEPEGRHWHKVPAVVVRMVVNNRDREVWSIDCATLDARLGEAQHAYPLHAYSDGREVWVVVLEPGETRSIDLYYELPEKERRPSVAIAWRVLTPAGAISSTTTSLARREAPPSVAPSSVAPSSVGSAVTGSPGAGR